MAIDRRLQIVRRHTHLFGRVICSIGHARDGIAEPPAPATIVGIIMIAHGTQKLFGWFGGYGLDATGQFFTMSGYPAGKTMAALAGLVESMGGVALGDNERGDRRRCGMVNVFQDPLFTASDVSQHLVIPRSTVYSWLSDDTPSGPLVHHVTPERRGAASVPFIAFVEAYVLRALRKELRFSAKRIREAVADVREEFNTPYGLASKRIATDGIDIFVQHSDEEFARVGDRQMPVREFIADYLRFIDWGDTGYAASVRLPRFPDVAPVIVDPRFSWGDPVVARNKVPVQAVVDLWRAGEPVGVVAENYGLTDEEVEAVCRAA
jgi:uncharacterized protein (DUF433 family)